MYGHKKVSQPGGGANKPTVERSVKTVTAPVRVGPAGTGNKPSAGMLDRKGR